MFEKSSAKKADFDKEVIVVKKPRRTITLANPFKVCLKNGIIKSDETLVELRLRFIKSGHIDIRNRTRLFSCIHVPNNSRLASKSLLSHVVDSTKA